MSGRVGAGVDLLEMVAGLFQTVGTTTRVKQELAKLKPQVTKLIAKNRGVLLVQRTDNVASISGEIATIQGIYLVGAGTYPEPLVNKWRTDPHIFPAPKGKIEETFLWVLRKKDIKGYLNRPPGMYPGLKDAAEIKYVPFEEL